MFLNILLNAVATGATTELTLLLEKFRKLNGDDKYNELVASLKNGFTLLKDVVSQTKTKVDDTLVNIVLNALP